MVAVLMISAKLATLGLLKMKVFWSIGYDTISFVHDLTNKILSCDSNYIVDVVMWQGDQSLITSIFMSEVIITWILWGFGQKKQFFEGCSWFKFNNLGLALLMTLKFYTSVAKRLKLKVRKFLGASSYICRSYRRKTCRGVFWPPYWIDLRYECSAIATLIPFSFTQWHYPF